MLLTVQADRNQVNYYAIASSPSADYIAETLECANHGKASNNERYCWLFPTRAAFDASNVDPASGNFSLPCWVAYGGVGVGSDQASANDIVVSTRSSYDLVAGTTMVIGWVMAPSRLQLGV